MSETEERIRSLFVMQRRCAADRILLQKTDAQQKHQDIVQREQAEAQRALNTIQAFLAILPEDEQFVIQRHLIDDIDWTRIVVEYEQKWGHANGRDKRTLMSYQKRGFERIAAYIEERKDIIDFTWFMPNKAGQHEQA